jgi:hypothetical protein
MITDIFIKTYHKDFIWLEYCLKSIKKFVSGFRNVVIVSDDDGHFLPPKFLTIVDNLKLHYVKLPNAYSDKIEHGVGYLWQQCVKLCWNEYSDADSVLIMDSDSMFTKPTTPDHFKIDTKFYWIYRKWENAGSAIKWKPVVQTTMNVVSDYEGMCVAVFMLQRETTVAFKNMFCTLHGSDSIWGVFVRQKFQSFSEFNAFGTFIEMYDRREYAKIYDPTIATLHDHSIIKSWSWGGLQKEDKKRRDDILLN